MPIKRITAKDLTRNQMTTEDGFKLFDAMDKELNNGHKIEVSFKGIHGLNSSYINGAFVNLLAHHPMDFIQAHVAIKHSTRQINELIKDRMAFENKRQVENLKGV